MKKLLLIGLVLSSFALAETQAMGNQCRANAADGAYGFATHINLYTAQSMAVQQCQATSRRPETCAVVSCFQM